MLLFLFLSVYVTINRAKVIKKIENIIRSNDFFELFLNFFCL
jgi:hypothetical protein